MEGYEVFDSPDRYSKNSTVGNSKDILRVKHEVIAFSTIILSKS